MSLAQREIWDNGKNKVIVSNKHIEIIRFDNAKISVREHWYEKHLSLVTYQPAIVKIVAGRLLIINPDNQEEYYDCKYEDCTIKRMNG